MPSGASPFVRTGRDARGFTLIELLIVMALVGILASLALVGYRLVKVRAAESTALSALQAINQAQFVFAQTCGHQRYSATLAGLGVPSPTSGQAFLSPDLTVDPVVKSGYQIAMTGTQAVGSMPACNGQPLVVTYKVTADPVSPGVTGLRFFGTNTDRVIYADAGSFTENMTETGPPPHGSEIQ